MKHKKTFFVLVFIIFITVSIPLVNCFVQNHPFLIPTTEWDAGATTLFGKPVSIKKYKTFGQSNPLFLRIDGDYQTPVCGEHFHWGTNDGKRRWFAVFMDEDEVLVMALRPPHSFPYLYFDSNLRHYGLDILNGDFEFKHGEKWFLYRIGESIIFSNNVITVTVSKKDPP